MREPIHLIDYCRWIKHSDKWFMKILRLLILWEVDGESKLWSAVFIGVDIDASSTSLLILIFDAEFKGCLLFILSRS